MGLFIIAGVLIVWGIIFRALYEEYVEGWMLWAALIGVIGGAMLFVLLLVMGTNRSEGNIINMKEDYAMYTLAIESCDTINDYMVIADEIDAYNATVKQHRKMRENKMTNWLFSPKIAEMPLIVVPNYKLQEAG